MGIYSGKIDVKKLIRAERAVPEAEGWELLYDCFQICNMDIDFR